MHDELKEEIIVNKVGGRFRLSSLIQKRLGALNKGARPLVESRSGDKLSIVLQEIMEDKIRLDTTGEVSTVESLNAELRRSKLFSDMEFPDE